MTKTATYENLECWQQARNLAVDVYHASMNGNLSKDFVLRDQLRKSAISIVSNIADGKERDTPAELIRFLRLAKASTAKLRTQLSISSFTFRMAMISSRHLLPCSSPYLRQKGLFFSTWFLSQSTESIACDSLLLV